MNSENFDDVSFEILNVDTDRGAFTIRTWCSTFKNPISSYNPLIFSLCNLDPQIDLNVQIGRMCLGYIKEVLIRESGNYDGLVEIMKTKLNTPVTLSTKLLSFNVDKKNIKFL